MPTQLEKACDLICGFLRMSKETVAVIRYTLTSNPSLSGGKA